MQDDFRDSQWQADYRAALAMLMGKPQLLLPAPRPEVYDSDNPYDVVPLQLTPYSVPVESHPYNPDSRADVLSRIRILKTPKPGLRLVLFDGVLVGKIAQSPYGPGWLADCTRARIFWSQDDAALALIDGSGMLA